MGALPVGAKPGSQSLLYMIFAMGALDLKTEEKDDDGFRYYQIARSRLQDDIMEHGTLPLVQALAIMANYLQRNNRPNAGYICLGWAIRMATALGLHMPVNTWRCSALEKETRTRAWWAITTLEAGLSVTLGRPSAINPAILSTLALPINCEEEHLTASSVSFPPACEHITLYSTLIIQARLARVASPLHDRILESRPAPTLEQIKRYDERIVKAVNDIPNFLGLNGNLDEPYCLARSVQVWRIRDLRAILYRPALLAAAWDSSNRRELPPAMREAIE